MPSQLLLDAKPRPQQGEPVRSVPSSPLVILGITTDGKIFRPSDWAQRLAAVTTIDCDYCGPSKQLPCNPLVKIVRREGVPAVWISPALAERNRSLYDYMLRFAEQNKLVVRAST